MNRFLFLIVIAVFSAFVALFHVSCSLTPEQRQTLATNALKDAEAAGIGYLTGGSAGAIAGAANQFIINHTSAKNPKKVTP